MAMLVTTVDQAAACSCYAPLGLTTMPRPEMGRFSMATTPQKLRLSERILRWWNWMKLGILQAIRQSVFFKSLLEVLGFKISNLLAQVLWIHKKCRFWCKRWHGCYRFPMVSWFPPRNPMNLETWQIWWQPFQFPTWDDPASRVTFWGVRTSPCPWRSADLEPLR